MGVLAVFRSIQRWLAPGSTPAAPADHAAALEQRLSAIEAQLMAQAEPLQATLSSLEKQLGRVGREQLKANTVVQTQADRWTEALELLRAADLRREAEIQTLRDQQQVAQATTRLELIRAILPTLDGLDQALLAGETILAHPPSTPPAGFWQRLRVVDQPSTPLPEVLRSWLTGLSFVRQRLLDVLAAEGIQPISAEGQPFDPFLHIAVELAPASADHPPGIVVRELRRGYRQGERIVRHSDVAVAQKLEA